MFQSQRKVGLSQTNPELVRIYARAVNVDNDRPCACSVINRQIVRGGVIFAQKQGFRANRREYGVSRGFATVCPVTRTDSGSRSARLGL